jgi:cation:H+ antiporter
VPKRLLVEYAVLFLFAISGLAVVSLTKDPVYIVAFFTFGAVVAASILIAWAAEASEFAISQGLALAIVAIVQTIPEYFVEGTIAWKAGQDPLTWLPNVIANFTGANRLLTGFGWPLILFTVAVQMRRSGKSDRLAIGLPREQSVEVVFMLGSSLYYLLILAKGNLTVIDSAILTGIFVVYMWILSRLPPETENPDQILSASTLALVKIKKRGRRIGAISILFIFSALVFVIITDPFVTSIQRLAIALLGPSSVFFFIQWIAPVLSEFPEKVTAFNWARKITLAPMALLNFLSSAVNELTALVALIPLVFSVSLGSLGTVPLGAHSTEIFLTMAQSVYACASLLDLEYNTSNAAILFGLWLVSTVFIDTRFAIALAFLVLAGAEVVIQRKRIRVFKAFSETLGTVFRR